MDECCAMNVTFIYALCEPDSSTSTIRYIGKTDNPASRVAKHVCEARSGDKTHRLCWIRSLMARGLRPKLVVLRAVSKKDWPEWEKSYIEAAIALGLRLTNANMGGEGGQSPSQETREKMSRAKVGKPFSVAHKSAISRSKLGKRQSATHRANNSAARTGKPLSEEHCEKSSLGHQKRAKRLGTTSCYLGVCWDSAAQSWKAGIKRRGKFINLGRFPDQETAAQAYNVAAVKYFGEMAQINVL